MDHPAFVPAAQPSAVQGNDELRESVQGSKSSHPFPLGPLFRRFYFHKCRGQNDAILRVIIILSVFLLLPVLRLRSVHLLPFALFALLQLPLFVQLRYRLWWWWDYPCIQIKSIRNGDARLCIRCDRVKPVRAIQRLDKVQALREARFSHRVER